MQYDIIVDGSIGGGSVLRVGVPLALGKKKSIRIYNIRSTRRKPGLRTQHLIALQILADVSGSELVGGHIGSTDIGFIPKNQETKNHIEINIPTAASVSLIVQALCNYVLISNKNVSLQFYGGGTHTNWSPSFDYLELITKPIFKIFNLDLDILMSKRGFYPKGEARGNVSISKIEGQHHIKFELTGSKITKVKIFIFASAKLSDSKVAERQIQRFQKQFNKKYDFRLETYHLYEKTASPGTAAIIFMEYNSGIPKGISVLGKRGISSEKIADKLFSEFEKNLQNSAALDEFMSDQIIVPLCTADKGSFVTIPGISEHVKTNLTLVNTIFGHSIEIHDEGGASRLVKV